MKIEDLLEYVDGDITKYRAQVMVGGKVHRVGNIGTVEEAARVASAMRDELHKDFKVKEV